jgi:hypothetical protein
MSFGNDSLSVRVAIAVFLLGSAPAWLQVSCFAFANESGASAAEANFFVSPYGPKTGSA